MYPLGRRHAPDERDKRFPMSAVLPAKTELPVYKYWAGSRTHLNQTVAPAESSPPTRRTHEPSPDA